MYSQRFAVRLFCGAGRAVIRGEQSAERRRVRARHPVMRRARAHRRRLRRLSIPCDRDALASRRSTAASYRPGPRFSPKALFCLLRADIGQAPTAGATFIRQRAPRSRAVVPGGRNPEAARVRGLRAHGRGSRSSLRLQNVSGDAPHERGCVVRNRFSEIVNRGLCMSVHACAWRIRVYDECE